MSTAPIVQTTPATSLAPKREPLAHLKNLLDAARPSMAAVLPKHLTVDRLVKVALVAVSKTPALMQADPMTVVTSVMQAAQLGLDPAGALGSAYLVPFFNGKTKRQECQLIVGYRGLLDLARRSGQIESVEARVVYAADTFRVVFGTETAIEHVPAIDGDPGPLRFVYGVAWLRDTPRPIVEVMTRAQIDAIRRRAKASDFGPWVTDYEEMARKTVIRRLSKYLPLTTELATALELAGVTAEPQAEIVPLPTTVLQDVAAQVQAPAEIEAGAETAANALPEAQGETPAPGEEIPVLVPVDVEQAAPQTRAGRIAAKAKASAQASLV